MCELAIRDWVRPRCSSNLSYPDLRPTTNPQFVWSVVRRPKSDSQSDVPKNEEFTRLELQHLQDIVNIMNQVIHKGMATCCGKLLSTAGLKAESELTPRCFSLRLTFLRGWRLLVILAGLVDLASILRCWWLCSRPLLPSTGDGASRHAGQHGRPGIDVPESRAVEGGRRAICASDGDEREAAGGGASFHADQHG